MTTNAPKPNVPLDMMLVSSRAWDIAQWEVHHRRYLTQELMATVQYGVQAGKSVEFCLEFCQKAQAKFDAEMLRAAQMTAAELLVELARAKGQTTE